MAFEERDRRELRRLIDSRYKIVLIARFQEAHEPAKRNVYTDVFEVMKQVSVNFFFQDEADRLLDDNMYQLAEPQQFTQGLVRRVKKLSSFKVSIAIFAR